LSPGEYRIVFASGKDRKPIGLGTRLHTNFKLNAAGEYLGLYNLESPRQAVSEFAPQFPEQPQRLFLRLDRQQRLAVFQDADARRGQRSSTITQILSPPHFSVQRGYFNQPFNLILSTTDSSAGIRYTTNGSEPTETNGVIYAGPIPVSRTTVLRAAAFKTDYLPSVVVTHTYLYGLSTALRSLPGLSIVTPTNNLLGPTGIIGIKGGTYINGPWQPVNPGDYHNPSQQGHRLGAAHFGRMDSPAGQRRLQMDCGFVCRGAIGCGRVTCRAASFRIGSNFRSDYGAGRSGVSAVH